MRGFVCSTPSAVEADARAPTVSGAFLALVLAVLHKFLGVVILAPLSEIKVSQLVHFSSFIEVPDGETSDPKQGWR